MVTIELELKEDFFEEEYRDGYLVTRDIKELWAIELDLLNKFVEVCEKYKLKYYLDGGTLLGAVRHKGFIPWDDDIDVVMMREEYDKLCKIANDEFKDPYLLQTVNTDFLYTRGHAQLRNINTCAMLPGEAFCVSFNQGVFIDIFVMDGLTKDTKNLDKQMKEIDYYKKILSFVTYRNSKNLMKYYIKGVISKAILFYFGGIVNLYKKFEKCALWYSNSMYVDKILFRDKQKIRYFMKNWFGEGKYLSFEGVKYRVPNNYLEVLELYYGKDYMTPKMIPSTHNKNGKIIIDTNKTYKIVLQELRER